jgi:hypothetical protein
LEHLENQEKGRGYGCLRCTFTAKLGTTDQRQVDPEVHTSGKPEFKSTSRW